MVVSFYIIEVQLAYIMIARMFAKSTRVNLMGKNWRFKMSERCGIIILK